MIDRKTVFPPDWSRFRDDCFSSWFGSHDDLVRLTDWLNSLSPSIKSTDKHSDKQLEVLDTLLCITNGRIESKVYSKPTDGHMYLLPRSSHYRYMHLHIPFGAALRIRRICSREDWFEEQLLKYKQYFKCRNYKNCVIHKGFDKARNIPRSQALKQKIASDQTVRNFALILDYHPNFNGLPLLIRDHLKILFESPRMSKVFSQDKTCIRTGFHRTKNLKDMLVKSSVQPVTTPQIDNPGCLKCHRNVCDTCQNFLLPYRRIISVATGKSYKIRQHLSCQTDLSSVALFVKNVIDSVSVQPLILDAVCPTVRTTKEAKRTCRLVNHFIDNSSDHPLDCLKFTLIEQVSNKTEKDLEEREGYWQAQHWTFNSFGFNAKK